jgi:hypothetical protein
MQRGEKRKGKENPQYLQNGKQKRERDITPKVKVRSLDSIIIERFKLVHNIRHQQESKSYLCRHGCGVQVSLTTTIQTLQGHEICSTDARPSVGQLYYRTIVVKEAPRLIEIGCGDINAELLVLVPREDQTELKNRSFRSKKP